MKIPKGAQESVDFALSLGFTVVRCKKHIVMRKGPCVVTIAKSPGTVRAVRNELKLIARINKQYEESQHVA